jgi:hypothetical protein
MIFSKKTRLNLGSLNNLSSTLSERGSEQFIGFRKLFNFQLQMNDSEIKL